MSNGPTLVSGPTSAKAFPSKGASSGELASPFWGPSEAGLSAFRAWPSLWGTVWASSLTGATSGEGSPGASEFAGTTGASRFSLPLGSLQGCVLEPAHADTMAGLLRFTHPRDSRTGASETHGEAHVRQPINSQSIGSLRCSKEIPSQQFETWNTMFSGYRGNSSTRQMLCISRKVLCHRCSPGCNVGHRKSGNTGNIGNPHRPSPSTRSVLDGLPPADPMGKYLRERVDPKRSLTVLFCEPCSGVDIVQ